MLISDMTSFSEEIHFIVLKLAEMVWSFQKLWRFSEKRLVFITLDIMGLITFNLVIETNLLNIPS